MGVTASLSSCHVPEARFEVKSLPRHDAAHREVGVPNLELPHFPEVRVADGRPELLAAYRLVFRRYAETGLVQRRPDGIIYSSEFAHGDSRTFVTLAPTGEVTATATVVIRREGDNDATKNSFIPWKEIATASNVRYAGVTCLAAKDSSSGPNPVAFFSLARFLFQYSKHRGCDALVISIHPRQLKFYGRICPIVPMGPAYRVPQLGDALAVACRIEIDAMSLMQRVAPSVLSWFESPIPGSELNRPGISPQDDMFLQAYAETADYRVPNIRSVKLVA